MISSFDSLMNEGTNILKVKDPNIKHLDYLLVSPLDQRLLYISNNKVVKYYSVSTSKFGLGNIDNSFKTPTGMHCIEEKIGANMPINTIFKGRKPIKNNMTLKDLYEDEELRNQHFENYDDVITSRILRLKGLEENINLGGDVDSYQRYIYIHGTAHEDKIGEKASHGCIRMLNEDVIELFDICQEKMLVLILDN